jgi:hypothetical protein
MEDTGKSSFLIHPNVMLQELVYSPESIGDHHLISTSNMAEKTPLLNHQ